MKPRILVIGDVMVDHYILGESTRISPEAPVLVVNVKNEDNRLGGACNVAYNLLTLGAEVHLYGAIGRDLMGSWLQAELDRNHIHNSLFKVSKPTTQKTRILISSQQVLRVDRENNASIHEDLQKDILQSLLSSIENFDVLVISDYNKGLLTPDLTQNIIQLAKKHKKPILCDPKGSNYAKYTHSTLLTPNKKEAQQALGIIIQDDDSLKKALQTMHEDYKLDFSLITLSEDGIALWYKNCMYKIPTIAQEVYDVTGAGDSVIAALALALAQKQDILEACEFANAVAAVVIGKVGSAQATQQEVHSLLHKIHKNTPLFFHINQKNTEILHILSTLKSSHKQIVFTNGCFDILHPGHIQYLQKTAQLGDVLIVGLNSDNSVRRLKGNSRPINSQQDRAAMLLALECVDYVFIFDEDTPENLIKLIQPDILTKGADYKGKKIAGSEFAKQIKLIDFLEGKSTSNLIEKLRILDKEKTCNL